MKKSLFLVFSHQLTDVQMNEVKERFNIEHFVSLPSNLQEFWSNVNPELDTIEEGINEILDFLEKEMKVDDLVLVQGDYGATFQLVTALNEGGVSCIYSTTKRNIIEYELQGKIVKQSIFEHVNFRFY